MVNVTVDPLTRIEGHLRVSTEVDANGVITDAQIFFPYIQGL